MKALLTNVFFRTLTDPLTLSHSRVSRAGSRIVLVLLCILLISGSTGVASASLQSTYYDNTCVIASRGLNLRSGPGYYPVVAAFPYGTPITTLSTRGSWSNVKAGSSIGWMHSSYLGDCSPKCDPNYSGYCVPVVSQDLDCKDVGRNFRVVGVDRHRFDGDGDGIACEYYSQTDDTSSSVSHSQPCDTNYSGYCVPVVSHDLDCKDVGNNFRVVGVDKHRFDGDGDGWCCER